MSASQIIFKGVIVMFIGVLFGIVCNIALLTPATIIQDGFSRAGVYDLENPEWDTRDDIDRVVIYLHIAVYLMPILSISYFGICIIKVLRYTSEDEYGAGQEQRHNGRF